jgi:hypothetical protein
MLKATAGILLPTTITGSLPRPSWYTENLGTRGTESYDTEDTESYRHRGDEDTEVTQGKLRGQTCL